MAGLMVAMAGCITHRPSTRSNSPGVRVDIPSGTSSHYTPHYYTTNFTCTTQGVTANGQLRLQPDSVLWASASKVIELGRASLTKDSVVVYVKVSGRCFRGTYDDLYRRFHYRTTFQDVVKMVTADDAEQQIAGLIKAFNVDATVELDPWQQVDKLKFPFSVPSNVKPL